MLLVLFANKIEYNVSYIKVIKYLIWLLKFLKINWDRFIELDWEKFMESSKLLNKPNPKFEDNYGNNK